MILPNFKLLNTIYLFVSVGGRTKRTCWPNGEMNYKHFGSIFLNIF